MTTRFPTIFEAWPADLYIVDPHQHFWDLERNIYPWLQQAPPPQLVCGDITPIRHSYLGDALRADIGSLLSRKTVHIQCDWNPQDPAGETRWLDDHARQHGFPTGIVAFARLQDAGVEALLEAHAGSPRLRGIRQILNWHDDAVLTFGAPRHLMRSADWRRGFALLRRFNLSFDLQIYPGQFPEAVEIAEAFPDTQLILNHGGMPVDRSSDGLAVWRDGLRRLTRRPNVAVKISGLGMVDHHWTIDSIAPIVRQIIDIAGVDRVMFASNFPVDRLYSSYRQIWQAFSAIIADASMAERRAMFAGNAERFYRI